MTEDRDRAQALEALIDRLKASAEAQTAEGKARVDAICKQFLEECADDDEADQITAVRRLRDLAAEAGITISTTPPSGTAVSPGSAPTAKPPEPFRVLVVDDDPGIRAALAAELRAEGYVVHTATDARIAINEVHAMPVCHCVLLDLMMPEYPGAAYLDFVRHTRHARIPRIIITAMRKTDVERIRQEIRNLEEDFVFTKPFDLEDLLATIRRKIEEGKPHG